MKEEQSRGDGTQGIFNGPVTFCFVYQGWGFERCLVFIISLILCINIAFVLFVHQLVLSKNTP